MPVLPEKIRRLPANPELADAERAQATLDSIGDAVLSTDVAGNVTYLNPVAERMTGWSASDASGRPLDEVMQIIDADSREPVRNPLAVAMAQDTVAGLREHCLLIRRDGGESAIEDTAAPVHDRHGQVIGAVIVFRDVGAARALSLRMSHLAQHDVLTGLPNRLLLTDRLERGIAASCRHGGDEFVVLLTDVACAEDAAFSADNLLVAIAAAHRVGDQDLHVTASVGISLYPADGTDPETLLRKADLALLRAKAQRRPWPPLAMAAATASQVASNASRVKPAPDGSQFPELPPASV